MVGPNEAKIDVSAKIVADISSGIYRTPANALKELVSNSFDADASQVHISTGYPHFNVITCYDNGNGMNIGEFKKIMKRIGGSSKRTEKDETSNGRRVIGKIGIGILAIAQICEKFTVISSRKGEPTKFEAIIDLKDFHKEANYSKNVGDITIGKYKYYSNLPEKKDTHYTKFIIEEVDLGFKKRLSDTENPALEVYGFEFRKNVPNQFLDFIEWLKGKRVREISEYNRLLWELALISPVEYLDLGPIKKMKQLDEYKKRIKSLGFKVFVDGVELRKPILFPSSTTIKKLGTDYKVWDDIRFDGIVDDKKLKFGGYFYYQRTRITPPELQGVLIRIRSVAINVFDKSILNYPKSEGPKMAQVSGEIYIEAGLEDALNIDRNSFNESDPHFLKLQEVLFERLGGKEGIFKEIRDISKKRNEKLKQKKAIEDIEKIISRINQLTNSSFLIKREKVKREFPVEIKDNKIVIYDSKFLPKKQSERTLYEKILIFYSIAKSKSNTFEEADRLFVKLLLGKKR